MESAHGEFFPGSCYNAQMRVVILGAVLTLSGCVFDPSVPVGTVADDGGVEEFDAQNSSVDATPLYDAAQCTGSDTLCSGSSLKSCVDGSWEQEECEFTCGDGQCVKPSNLTTACAIGYESFVMEEGQEEVLFLDDSGPIITSSPTIEGTITSGLAVFCLTSLDLPVGVTLKAEPGFPWPIVLVVEGDVMVNGTIDLSGGHEMVTLAGPGGGLGGELSSNDGNEGAGVCGGGGGLDNAGNAGGGGGGGGGFAGMGGLGGVAVDGALGGVGGLVCGEETLMPLVAGSGGGSGGDGSGGDTGWPGGGGGGAIQISSKTSVRGGGSFIVRGGDGDTGMSGGGGGGGSGGAVLLEAPDLTLTSLDITVEGGSGGVAGGGGGGGGGGGRVRLNGSPTPSCASVLPVGSCTAGTMVVD